MIIRQPGQETVGSKTNRHKPTVPARLDVHIHPETKQHLLAYVAAKGESQGSVVDTALREYLAGSSQAVLIRQELDRLSRGMGRIERQLEALDAGTSGFVQMWLAYNPPLPIGEKAKAQALAEERFGQFIHFLSGQLRQRQGFIARLTEDGLLGDENIRALFELDSGG